MTVRCKLYRIQYESSLLSIVSEEVSGNFGKMVTYSLMETDDYGAEIFSSATDGEFVSYCLSFSFASVSIER